MTFVDVNGTRLYVEDTGPGSTGQTIAFSHGLLWSTELFAPQIAALRGRYRCIAWDHRGQGQSAADRRHCIGIELVTQDAIALLEHIAPGPIHLAGLSMGGFVAMRIAARRPELVRSLILMETSADPEPEENAPRYRLLATTSRLIGLRPIVKRVLPIMLGKTVLADPSRKADVARFAKIMTARKDAWRATNGVIDRAGCADELGRIRTPTLVIVGDEDVATVPAKARRLADGIAGAKLVEIAGAGHSSTVEQPARVTAAIEELLQ
ncbi:MAG TPA: alpha/beta fold hydrolase [Kofleriaceae bacterium]|jgi:pimeloyl-ACP methyl ester carboxylesterase